MFILVYKLLRKTRKELGQTKYITNILRKKNNFEFDLPSIPRTF